MDETEIVRTLSTLEQECKEHDRRLTVLEKQTKAVSELATSVAIMAQKVDGTGRKVDALCADVQGLKDEPAKKWRFVVEKSIYIIISAVIGYILARIGLA